MYCGLNVSVCEYSRRMRCSSMRFQVKLDKHELLNKILMLLQITSQLHRETNDEDE